MKQLKHYRVNPAVLACCLIFVALRSEAQTPAGPPPSPASPSGPARGGRGGMAGPKKGVCPLPTLVPLPADKDESFYADENVPHGKVETVTYKNYAGVDKSMHIYIPPAYGADATATYPVLYLNHGGGDNDAAWTTKGSVQFILDNLIAAGKAKRMLIAMPDSGKCASAIPSAPGKDDACTIEYLKDVIPYMESHYRAASSRQSRAIAGLSMGGFVAMHTGLPHLDTFSEIYVYSSGHINATDLKTFEENFSSMLQDPKTNDLFRVPYYMAAGETDIALPNAERVMAIFNQDRIRNFWVLSTGGHEWMNWRRYLYQTAQIMFPDCAAQ